MYGVKVMEFILNNMQKSNKEKVEMGECPKCHYFLIKNHPTARCSKDTCGFEMGWKEYKSRFTWQITMKPFNLEF